MRSFGFHGVHRSFALIASGALLLMGCTIENADDGVAPQLSSVTLAKTEIPVGKVETVTITIEYEDADGDVANINEQATSAAGTSQKTNTLALSEAMGQTKGTHAFALQLGAGSPGTVTLAFWLKDSKGNESAKLTKTITIK